MSDTIDNSGAVPEGEITMNVFMGAFSVVLGTLFLAVYLVVAMR
jgi:hypothetical protein